MNPHNPNDILMTHTGHIFLRWVIMLPISYAVFFFNRFHRHYSLRISGHVHPTYIRNWSHNTLYPLTDDITLRQTYCRVLRFSMYPDSVKSSLYLQQLILQVTAHPSDRYLCRKLKGLYRSLAPTSQITQFFPTRKANALDRENQWLRWRSYGTHKYTMWAKLSFLMLQHW
jgi:hypothetical protein